MAAGLQTMLAQLAASRPRALPEHARAAGTRAQRDPSDRGAACSSMPRSSRFARCCSASRPIGRSCSSKGCRSARCRHIPSATPRKPACWRCASTCSARYPARRARAAMRLRKGPRLMLAVLAGAVGLLVLLNGYLVQSPIDISPIAPAARKARSPAWGREGAQDGAGQEVGGPVSADRRSAAVRPEPEAGAARSRTPPAKPRWQPPELRLIGIMKSDGGPPRALIRVADQPDRQMDRRGRHLQRLDAAQGQGPQRHRRDRRALARIDIRSPDAALPPTETGRQGNSTRHPGS